MRARSCPIRLCLRYYTLRKPHRPFLFLIPSLEEPEAAAVAMRMSCNGCRVLRKGCSEDCSIRPCLQWIKNPESQANATVFLAKFYGRAGLMNLINAGPEHLRPAIFRSLLYEACGRIVNPIYGSVGLLWSGSWQMCQAAVEAVLKGAPVVQIPSETAANTPAPPLKAYDIRHVSKDDGSNNNNNAGGTGSSSAAPGHDLHKVNKATRTRFKRPGSSSGNSSVGLKQPKASQACGSGVGSADDANLDLATDPQVCNLRWRRCYPVDCQSAPSHESSGSHDSVPVDGGGAAAAASAAAAAGGGDGESRENESMFSTETPDASMVTSHGEQWKCDSGGGGAEEGEIELELTLGFEPVPHSRNGTSSPRRSEAKQSKRCEMPPLDGLGSDTCKVDLALDLAC